MNRSVKQKVMQRAQASYDRCREKPEFFREFYKNFFRRCPEVEPYFANTDFERQYHLLKHAISMLLIFPNQPRREPTILTRVADRHGPGDLDIPPAYYPCFVDALVSTARDFDPEFTADTESAWRATVAPGISYMQSRYDRV